MNVENLARTAIDRIKSEWGLPKTGFIAGGSIANIIWELVSGNKATVNDIDVFVFNGIVDENSLDKNDNTYFSYVEKEKKYWEDYGGIKQISITKDFYMIESVDHEGIFNNILYKSNKYDNNLVLKSFDINATGVGYSIDEDKVYWTKEFEDFLKTGKLLICNLTTPSHTAIRIVKKSKELNCELDEFELKLIKHALYTKFNDTIRYRFKERYNELFNKYKEELEYHFTINRDIDIEGYLKKNFEDDSNIYFLYPKYLGTVEDLLNPCIIFNDDDNINRLYNSHIFLFYMRNIYKKDNLPSLWGKLYFFIDKDYDKYLDIQPSEEDLNLISRLGKYAPNSIGNLKGLKLSEQIKIVKSVLDKYEEDPIIAISILEKHKVNDIELSEENLLLLELSVRRNIVNDTKGKVNKILGDEEPPGHNYYLVL